MDILIKSYPNRIPYISDEFFFFLKWTQLYCLFILLNLNKYFINYNNVEYIYYICYLNLKIYYTSLSLRTDYLLVPFMKEVSLCNFPTI